MMFHLITIVNSTYRIRLGFSSFGTNFNVKYVVILLNCRQLQRGLGLDQGICPHPTGDEAPRSKAWAREHALAMKVIVQSILKVIPPEACITQNRQLVIGIAWSKGQDKENIICQQAKCLVFEET